MVKKDKTLYECTACGHQTPKWNGKCMSCNEWNTYVETIVTSQVKSKIDILVPANNDNEKPIPIEDVPTQENSRLDSRNSEFNRVLGGGIVPGSIILIGGQPGIGKSTLLLQTALGMNETILYVSGEESNYQIKLRAERISEQPKGCLLYNATDINSIIKEAQKIKPQLLIIDSIQTCSLGDLESLPGSVSQIRACAQLLQQYSKKTGIAVVLIGHINKEGQIAGPMILEHIVDAVLIFEGDRNYRYRILRAAKNRFGNTDEIGIFDMKATGLEPISNPSELFLSDRNTLVTGQAIGTVQEGRRTVLSEVQSLITKAIFGTPQRSTTGFDSKRLHMILAVIENKLGIYLGQKDVFLNIAGGLKINETSLDMAVIAAIMSASEGIIIPSNYCFIGEISLSGDFANVSHLEQRIIEAERLGFEKIIIPTRSENEKLRKNENIYSVKNVRELAEYLN